MNQKIKLALSGIIAGSITGLFGAGGGMLLVPLLTDFVQLDEERIFPTSVAIILPVCATSLVFSWRHYPNLLSIAPPYLLGGILGGLLAGFTGNKIPVKWLHRFLGILILYGGIRYLC